MRKYLSIVLVLIFLTTISTSVFAENIQTDNAVNESIDKYDIENSEGAVIENHYCSSCRIPNLTLEAQEQLRFFDPAEATDFQEDATFLDTYAVYYFLKLEDHIPNNFRGSCSYVAATMLLSYYDTYWDDAIVEDQYEEKSEFNTNLSNTKSPSTKTNYDDDIISLAQAKYEDKTTFTDAEYYEVLKDLSETDLQRKLIKIAVEEHIDGIFEYFSLFPHEVKLLLEHYLYEEVGFSPSEVSVELVIPGITDIKEYAIEKVKQGIPVFVSAASSLNSAHSFIIYDYDEENDELYCHMGWGSDKTHVAFSTIKYQVFEGAVTINFASTSEHSHSDNYVDSEDNTYCSCYFSCHPEHEHRYKVQEGAENYHTYDCFCEPPQYELHEYIHINTNNDNTHIKKCTKCEYQFEQNHSWEKTYNNDTHTFTCKDCGHVKTDSHNIEVESCDSNVHRYCCTECDYSIAEEHIKTYTSVDNILHFVKCSVCEYEGNEYHSTKYADLGDGTHSDSCEECGYYSIENHAFVCKSVDGTYHRSVCDACGLVNGANEAHVWGSYSNPKYFKCTLCGHLKLVTGPGIIPINPTNKNDEIEETE